MRLRNATPSRQQSLHTPSRSHGISSDLEGEWRHLGCDLIQAAGVLLRLPQVVMATAQILFHRFYYTASLRDAAILDTGMGALMLASKVQECPIAQRDVINVFHFLSLSKSNMSYEPMGYYSDTYYEIRDALNASEMEVLIYLGFNAVVHLPYGFLVNYLGTLDLRSDPVILQAAWNNVNDFLRSEFIACYQPENVACAAIHLAVLESDSQPFLPFHPRPWWEIFDTKEEDIIDIISEIRLTRNRQSIITEKKLPLTRSDILAYLCKQDIK